jgi:hypothetical protein
MTIQVFNPLTGAVVSEMTPSAGVRFTLAQGPQAYLIRGHYDDGGPARIDLDAVNDPRGLLHRSAGDGETVPATVGGRNARRNADPGNDFYMYFAAADWFTYQGNHPTLYIVMDYFDDGSGALALQYDSNTGSTTPAFYKAGGSVALTDSDSWKKHVFRVTDAYVGNRQNHGSDFRIAGGAGQTFYLDGVSVTTTLLAGDADLDSDVDVADLGILASNWQSAGTWVTGDFDFSGIVEVNDLGLLASNWQSGVSAAPAPMDGHPRALAEVLSSFGLPSASVPEPSHLGLLFAVALACRRRCKFDVSNPD